MQQFFVDDCQIGKEYVTITGSDVMHIKNVLRMKPGEKIRISSGSRRNLLCQISELTDNFVQADIIDENMPDTELMTNITLFQAIPKGSRMDTVIQKSVELGAVEIVPVEMKYCVVRLDEKKAVARQKRWQAIAESAAKQSKRSIVPKVHPVMNFQDAVQYGRTKSVQIVPYENAVGMQSTRETLNRLIVGDSIAVFIGPEGGFAPEEIEELRHTAFVISLGKRILRTDTAAIAVLSMLMLDLEDKEEELQEYMG